MLFIGVGGAWFFSSQSDSTAIIWFTPWILLVAATAYNLNVQPYLVVMEGLGKIGLVAKIRMQQSIVGNILMWIFFFSGFGLFSVFILPLASGIITKIYSRFDQDLMLLDNKNPVQFTIVREIFPMQSKIALSWASGYFVFQAITPIVFSKIGSVEAGKFGLGLAAFNAVHSIGTTWISVKGPQFAKYIAQNKYNALFVSFIRALRITLVMTFSGVGLVFLGIVFIDSYIPSLAMRFPAVGAMIPLGINCAINSIISSLALYMRAHKQEPLLVSSVVCSIFSVSAVYLASGYGFNEVCWAYALVTVLIGLPWTYVVFRKFNQ